MKQTRRRFLRSTVLGAGAAASTLSGERCSNAAGASKGLPSLRRLVRGQESSRSPRAFFAKAIDFEESVIYRPAKYPGYASWVAPFRGADGSLFLSFIEERRAPNPNFHAIPISFWEAMTIPLKYQSSIQEVPDILMEDVILQSHDQGNTWKEVGRCSTTDVNAYALLSRRDGSFLRGTENNYQAYYEAERVFCTIQRSTDMGNRWQDYSIVGEDHLYYPYRLNTLRDGALVLLLKYSYAFGPGRAAPQRNMVMPHMRTLPQAAFYYSYDQGTNWEGPVPVFPGVAAWEPDMVELPSGDLLLVNSDMQGGANTRQRVRRQGARFVPEPVFGISQGPVPEMIILTKHGLLVGARRGGVYSCSRDEGDTWYPIGGLPNSLYQPRIMELDDGRLCNFFHFGGDNIFGQVDQYIAKHVFRLEAHLPAPTVLQISRDKNAAGTQYINAFTASLKAGEDPVPAKEVKFTVQIAARAHRTPETKEYLRQTDTSGQAHVKLEGFEGCIDIHQSYTVQAEFTPAGTDSSLTPKRSSRYQCYAMTPTVGKKNTYPFFVSGRQLFVVPAILEEFPEISNLVKIFGLRDQFSTAQIESELKLTRTRTRECVDMLVTQNVLRYRQDKLYSWNGVRISEVRPIEVEDDFTV